MTSQFVCLGSNPTIKASVKLKTAQSVIFVIFKKDMTIPDWPHFSSSVLDYVEEDSSQWTGEGDESEVVQEDGPDFTDNDGETMNSVFSLYIDTGAYIYNDE